MDGKFEIPRRGWAFWFAAEIHNIIRVFFFF